MFKNIFIPHHINATPEDLAGNQGIGRYIFLPGAEGRAKQIAEHFEDRKVKSHYRGHNLYLGILRVDNRKIDVATVSSGMGCPSMEIILHELFNLGAKRFLRMGTAGTLQPHFIQRGNFVNVQASVRDEDTTRNYAPIELPAIASLEFISSIFLAAGKLGLTEQLHTGIVHCKSSLYAREFGFGPRSAENQAYLNLLTQFGVLASEMETATLFIQSQFYNYQLMQLGRGPENRVFAGAILSVMDSKDHLEESLEIKTIVENLIKIGLETVKILATQELIS